jgi:tetratricopeptide (TPR) repeat protein
LVVLSSSLAMTSAAEPNQWAILFAQANDLNAKGKYQEAEQVYIAALREAEQQPGHQDEFIAVTLDGLGKVLLAMGRYQDAERLFRRALKSWEGSHAGSSIEVAILLNNLAGACARQRRYAEAERFYRRSLALKVRLSDPGSPEVAIARANLGDFYLMLNDYPKAAAELQEALRMVQGKRRDPYLDAAILNNLAVARHGMGQYAEAEALLRSALEIWREMLEPGHPTLALGMVTLAQAQASLGRYPEAEKLLNQALTIITTKFSPGHPAEVTIRKTYADILKRTKRKKEAEKMLERALAIEEESGRAASVRHRVDAAELLGGGRR